MIERLNFSGRLIEPLTVNEKGRPEGRPLELLCSRFATDMNGTAQVLIFCSMALR